MLGLHPGETLVTLLPTFCCSVPRGVSFFFFFSVLLAVAFLVPEELSVAHFLSKRVVFLLGWAGDALHVERFILVGS